MEKAAGSAPRTSMPGSMMLPPREFFLGFAKVHILYHASREPIYGEWFLEELARHGYYQLSYGTMYPLFHDLESTGYLKREDRIVGGKVRKYYAITPEGRRALGEARDRIRALVDEIMEGEGLRITSQGRAER